MSDQPSFTATLHAAYICLIDSLFFRCEWCHVGVRNTGDGLETLNTEQTSWGMAQVNGPLIQISSDFQRWILATERLFPFRWCLGLGDAVA